MARTGQKLLGDEVASDWEEHEQCAYGQRGGGQHRWHEALDQPLLYPPPV